MAINPILDPDKPTKKQIMWIDLEKAKKSRTVLEMRRYVYRRWFYDDNFFINYFLSHHKKDRKTWIAISDCDAQKELRESLSSGEDVLCVFPRNHAKTTNNLFILVKDVCYKREPHIGLVMWESLGVETVGKIRDEFESNERIKDIFGRLVPEKTKAEALRVWSKKRLDFTNWIKIEAMTMKGKIRGKRFTKIVVDDPQEDKDVRNVWITEQFIDRFFKSVYPILDPSGNCIVLWTNIGELSFVNFLLKNNRGFKILEYAAVKDPVYEVKEDWKKHLVWGTPLWPWKWTIEALDEMLQTVWRKIFQQEYMNVPTTLTGERVFKVPEELPKMEYTEDERYAWLRFYKKPCQCSRGIDLSMGWNNGDFSTIVARDEDYNLVFVYQARVLWYELILVIDYLDELWYVWTKVFERNLWTAQAIFDVAQGKPRFVDIYQQKTIWRVNEVETLNFWRFTNRQNKEKMIAEMQVLLDWFVDEFWQHKQLKEFDKREINEMKFYVFDDKGWMNAMQGHHDDIIIADALCNQWVKDMYGI